MITCKKCGKSFSDLTVTCPECSCEILLSRAECTELYSKMREARRSREYELSYPLCQRLADARYIPAVREWGALLESGELGEVRLDEAMRYFKLGATLSDGYSAYRYSRLVGRESTEDSNFWLLFSAALGTPEAAPAAAKLLDSLGEREAATYYYALSAKCDNINSIVTLAKRYNEGIGAEKNDSHAAWYMEKLTLPPIHAIGLAYKLRTATPKEPPPPKNPTLTLARVLIKTAGERGFHTAERRLTEILSDAGDAAAMVRLGVMYAEGIGGASDIGRAMLSLEFAALHGDGGAYKILGDYYVSGKIGDIDVERALDCYRHAAKLGEGGAYRLMGDVYLKGELIPRDISRAAELYALGIEEGDTEAKTKYDAIVEKREELLSRAVAASGEKRYAEAFTLFSLSASMGNKTATLALARAYLVGEGTQINKRRAVELLSGAADEGVSGAYFPLALCYSRGIGVRMNHRKALKLLSDANAVGDGRAMPEAKKLKARVEKRLAGSAYSRAIRLLYLKKPELAVGELEFAMGLRHAKATYTLGTFFEFGFGVACDKERAYELYEQALDEGYTDERNNYKLAILKLSRKKK